MKQISQGGGDGYSGTKSIWMRTVFCCFVIYVYFLQVLEFMWFIQKKESITFNFLGANLLSCKSGYCHENQPVILIVIGPEIN